MRFLILLFELASGLRINLNKSTISPINMASDSADKVTTLRGINVQFLPSNYLGVPLRGKPLSKRFWTNISDKIHKKMSSWKYSYLSKGGKITLINSSLVSLPIYQLFVFKALVSTYKAIEKTWRNFFWNHSEEDRKMHLIRWSVITSPKDKGGLGISRIKDTNVHY